jgi:hypothetical protein
MNYFLFCLYYINKTNTHIIKLSDAKWHDIMSNEQILFLKIKNISKKYVNTDICFKYSSWDDRKIINCYRIANRIKNNKNIIKYICYFEFEDNIVNYLTDSNNNTDDNNESSVIIKPVYEKIINCKYSICYLKQIILTIFYLLFNYNIFLEIKDINYIYIDQKPNPIKLIYNFGDYSYTLYTKYIIKIDISDNNYIVINLSKDDNIYLLLNAHIMYIFSLLYININDYDINDIIDTICEFQKIFRNIANKNKQLNNF